MKTVREKITDLRTQEAATALERVNESQAEVSNIELGMMLGASGVMRSLVDSMSVKMVRAIQSVRETKAYEQAGFKRFDEFLDNYPHSPMNYARFNRMEKQLELEGEAAFETLNTLGIPLSTRKLITDGAVKIEGDEIHIGDQHARLDDRPRITEIIRSLADKTAEQTRTIERGKKEVTKLKKERDVLQSGSKFRAGCTPYEQAQLNLIGAFNSLFLEARKLPPDQLEAVRPNTLALIASHRSQLEEAFGHAAPLVSGAQRAAISDDEIDEIGDLM